MDWQFRPPSHKSHVSGETFHAGERIICWIYLDEEGQIQRMDAKSHEYESVTVPGKIIGRWSREVRSDNESEKAAKRQSMASAEELFLSLFDETVEPSEEQHALRYLLALWLERKRILKTEDRKTDQGLIIYRHLKTKKIYSVPSQHPNPEVLMNIESQLSTLVS